MSLTKFFNKKNNTKLGLFVQYFFMGLVVFVGLTFVALTIYGIIVFFQGISVDGF